MHCCFPSGCSAQQLLQKPPQSSKLILLGQSSINCTCSTPWAGRNRSLKLDQICKGGSACMFVASQCMTGTRHCLAILQTQPLPCPAAQLRRFLSIETSSHISCHCRAHIGHARVYISFDILYRYLQHLGYNVTYVRNFTGKHHACVCSTLNTVLPLLQTWCTQPVASRLA